MTRLPPTSTLFPYTTLFRSSSDAAVLRSRALVLPSPLPVAASSPAVFSKQRSEEHTSELQSRQYLVCRLLLEKKKQEGRRHHACIVGCFELRRHLIQQIFIG